jgi:lipid-A-disaccharide synthase
VQPVDLLILSNGPGELATWVKPTASALRQQLGDDRAQVRISVVLSPCPHATGKETQIALSYPEIDRVQGAAYFWQFLLWGKTAENWGWRDRGVVLFLGGDQIFPVVIGKRLGYRTVVYAEWEARWPQWIDAFGVMKPKIKDQIPQRYAHKLTVVGDLIAEVGAGAQAEVGQQTLAQTLQLSPDTELIGLLPGSKPAKLTQGVPLMLAIAEAIHAVRPQTRFVIPVAPTLEIQTLAQFADPQRNALIPYLKGAIATLVLPTGTTERPFLKTHSGLRVDLWTESPHYPLLKLCRLCLTTVGANTAELGALAVPMIVLLPTQQLDAMRAWDGLPGLLANLPGVGSGFAWMINWVVMHRLGLVAWPNLWAGKEIVPELLGQLQPQSVAELALDWLKHPEKLEAIRNQLRHVRGQPGAAQKLAQLVSEQLHLPLGIN